MSKVIRLSDDAGVTWENLPGGTGSFNSDAEGITDTILGQSFESQEVGLITWNTSGNAIWKGFAGYLAKILKQGTSTAFTDDAASQESGLIYAIDDATKAIWNRAVGITVEDNAVAVAEADIEWVDYLFGRFKFVDGYTVTGPVTVTGEYYPTVVVGRGNSYNLTMTANAIDNTYFENAQTNDGYRTFEPGLRTVGVELSGIYYATADLVTLLQNRDELILEIDPAGNGKSIARGFFKSMTTGQEGDVGALEEESNSFVLTVPEDAKVHRVFSWQHAADTTLPQSIQIALTAWLNETEDTLVQYLPSGAEGQSPLDGKEGTGIFTDISLSGGLSDMNTFVMDIQGSGAYDIV